MHRVGKVKIEWSSSFAYAIGLITTDGNLSKDRRHINFTSKDRKLVIQFKKCLNLKNRIGMKARGGETTKKYYQVQFGDRNFYDFLLSLGLMPNKSRKLKKLRIAKKYFADFFRGCIDGDGSITSFKHPESKHKQIRIKIASASFPFLHWLKNSIKEYFLIRGGWITPAKRTWELVYGKRDALELFRFIYYSFDIPCLARKRKRAKSFLRV